MFQNSADAIVKSNFEIIPTINDAIEIQKLASNFGVIKEDKQMNTKSLNNFPKSKCIINKNRLIAGNIGWIKESN